MLSVKYFFSLFSCSPFFLLGKIEKSDQSDFFPPRPDVIIVILVRKSVN